MITSNEMSPADIAAVTNNGNTGLWGGGDGAWWLIVLFLFAFVGGNGFGGWVGNANAGGAVPYIMNTNTGAEVQRGFDQAAVMGALGDINMGLVNGFSQAEIAANARQMADMQQSFNSQISMMQNMNALQALVNQACNDNRAATADLKYTVATEACADRAAVTDALQNITMQQMNQTNAFITEVRNGVQSIKDQMCQDKLDSKDDIIAQLRSELMFSRGQSSLDVQTATISAGQRALANEIEQYVNPTPRPAYIVQNPNGCNCGTFNTGCGTF